MDAGEDTTNNVLRFRPARTYGHTQREQKNLLEAVYAAGSFPVNAPDRATKVMASRLHLFGLVVIEEIAADGARRLRPSETMHAATEHAWRVSKPSLHRQEHLDRLTSGRSA
jgi:hypothetical protein